MGASPTSLLVTTTALISNVCSSVPRWTLRQTRRLAPPCGRAFQSPSPSTMIPVLSAARQRFVFKPRTGIKRCSGPLRVPMRNGDGKGRLTTAGRAEVRHVPVQADQAKQALDEASRLPQRHAKKHLDRQAGLDCSVTAKRDVAHACRSASPPTPCQDRTSLAAIKDNRLPVKGSSKNHGA